MSMFVKNDFIDPPSTERLARTEVFLPKDTMEHLKNIGQESYTSVHDLIVLAVDRYVFDCTVSGEYKP